MQVQVQVQVQGAGAGDSTGAGESAGAGAGAGPVEGHGVEALIPLLLLPPARGPQPLPRARHPGAAAL